MGKKGGGSAPPAPDPAKQVADEAATNRVTAYRPDGSLAIQYGYIDGNQNFVGGAPPGASLPQSAVRTYESAFEKNIRETQEGAAQNLASQIATQADNFNPAPTYDASGNQVAQTIYDRSADLMRDDVEEGRRRLDNSLQARGLAPGSNAYNRALEKSQEVENQNWSNLAKDAYLAGQQESRSDYGMAEDERARRLNELSGLIGGGYSPGAIQTQTGANPINTSGIYANSYNQQAQAYNNAQQQSAANSQATMQGIGSLASIAALAFLSSRQAKTVGDEVDGDDALRIIARAPARHWRYLRSVAPTDRAHHAGPIAEELYQCSGLGLPDRIHPADPIGILWAAVNRMAQRISELETELLGSRAQAA